MNEDERPIGSERSHARNAQLALLLEVAGTPKPGNVDRRRDLDDLRFEQFLAGAIGAADGLELAASVPTSEGKRNDGDVAPLGEAFERAIAGMSTQRGGNTQFGCLLLLVPLVRTAATGELGRERASAIVESTTVADAIAFYRSFEHVDVAVADPPAEWDDLDVRRGSAAAPAIRDRGLTWYDVMELSAEPTDDRPPDGNAREWVRGFPRSFAAADRLLEMEGPIGERTARVFLELLADEPDTLVAIDHGESIAKDVCDRAAAVGNDLEAADRLAEEFVAEGINPGTTADVTAAALYVALERGLEV